MEAKKLNYRAVILIFLAGTAFLTLFALNQKKSFQLETLKLGRPAPNFAYPGLDGKTLSLSDYRGKVVLVNIWATWCRPCIDEMPSMEKLYNKLKGEDFEILAVSIDAQGHKAVTPFMRTYKLTFPALIDSEATIQNLYKATGIPESFIINKNGILVKKIIGSLNWDTPEVLRFFRNLIKK
jgi:peroxiredoxin